MRDYQRERNNPYYIPKNLYRQTLSLIRDYSRLKENHRDIMEATHAKEEGRGSKVGDPTFGAACRLESISNRIFAIEKAWRKIPEEYHKGIWENIIEGRRYPDDAGRNTYGRWKAKFVYAVAENMNWI